MLNLISIDFLEGLKRAQCSRLEDQRGTEINFELPDFLKDKENFKNAGNKHRRIKQLEPIPMARSNFDTTTTTTCVAGNSQATRPQPAPRLSITRGTTSANISVVPVRRLPADANDKRLSPSIECNESIGDTTIVFEHQPRINRECHSNGSTKTVPMVGTDSNGNTVIEAVNKSPTNGTVQQQSTDMGVDAFTSDNSIGGRGPPPLPPKPKVLPMKPSNWGQQQQSSLLSGSSTPSRTNGDSNSKMLKNNFLDQSSSSFV